MYRTKKLPKPQFYYTNESEVPVVKGEKAKKQRGKGRVKEREEKRRRRRKVKRQEL